MFSLFPSPPLPTSLTKVQRRTRKGPHAPEGTQVWSHRNAVQRHEHRVSSHSFGVRHSDNVRVSTPRIMFCLPASNKCSKVQSSRVWPILSGFEFEQLAVNRQVQHWPVPLCQLASLPRKHSSASARAQRTSTETVTVAADGNAVTNARPAAQPRRGGGGKPI